MEGDGGDGGVLVAMEENGEMEKKREVMSPSFLCLFFFFFFLKKERDLSVILSCLLC